MNKIKPSKANLSMRYLSLFSVVFVTCIKWIPVAFVGNMLFIYPLCSDNLFAKLPFCFLLHSITYTIFCLIVHWLCNFPSEFNTFSLFPFHNLGTWLAWIVELCHSFFNFLWSEIRWRCLCSKWIFSDVFLSSKSCKWWLWKDTFRTSFYSALVCGIDLNLTCNPKGWYISKMSTSNKIWT